MPPELLVTASTDFSSIDAAGRVASLTEFIPVLWYPLEPGRLVQLHDHEGNSCLGVIEEVDDDLLHIRPIWSTWESASRTVLTAPAVATAPFVGVPETSVAWAFPMPIPPTRLAFA